MAGEVWGKVCSRTAGTKECGSHEAPMVIRVLLQLSLLEDGRRKKIAANGIVFMEACWWSKRGSSHAGARLQGSGEPRWGQGLEKPNLERSLRCG
jgi:hypothetical protein